jgi:DNA-binding XRE family transcriptional regulator
LRIEHRLSQKEMADLLNITTSGYAGKENGHRSFKTHEAIMLSSFFSVPISEIENFLPPSTQNVDCSTQEQQSA